jgi:Xaa-Pro aminopeptidase
MQKLTNETVGEKFQLNLLQEARDKTFALIEQVSAVIRPGMTENEARTIIQKIQKEMGSARSWHAPQIRFGENTLMSFGQKGKENNVLGDNDIFFLDLGPLFNDHEGDVGRPFTVGTDTEMQKCCIDAQDIWNEVRNHWLQESASGHELYQFATKCAESRGWKLLHKEANGHRISDFPHAIHIRGTIEGFEDKPAPDRWILEIQIRHPSRPFGAFYEDLLH